MTDLTKARIFFFIATISTGYMIARYTMQENAPVHHAIAVKSAVIDSNGKWHLDTPDITIERLKKRGMYIPDTSVMRPAYSMQAPQKRLISRNSKAGGFEYSDSNMHFTQPRYGTVTIKIQHRDKADFIDSLPVIAPIGKETADKIDKLYSTITYYHIVIGSSKGACLPIRNAIHARLLYWIARRQ